MEVMYYAYILICSVPHIFINLNQQPEACGIEMLNMSEDEDWPKSNKGKSEKDI